MKKPAALLLLALATTVLLPAQTPVDRFGDLKAKIDALLAPRLKPEPLPEKPDNPFRFTLPGIPLAATDPKDPAAPAPSTLTDDDQILAYGVSRFRITGTVLRGGVSHLLINSATYKESDLIPFRTVGETVYYIRVVRISWNEVTFGYNASRLVVPLPN